jgi:hypothetical protein
MPPCERAKTSDAALRPYAYTRLTLAVVLFKYCLHAGYIIFHFPRNRILFENILEETHFNPPQSRP